MRTKKEEEAFKQFGIGESFEKIKKTFLTEFLTESENGTNLQSPEIDELRKRRKLLRPNDYKN